MKFLVKESGIEKNRGLELLAKVVVVPGAMVLIAGVGTALADYNGTYSGGLNQTNVSSNSTNNSVSTSRVMDLASSNHLTGPESLNKNRIDIKNKLDIDIYNKNYEKNDLDFLFNSGKNHFEEATDMGSVRTGSVSANIALSNNSNGGGVGAGTTAGTNNYGGSSLLGNTASDPITFSNSLTGPESVNVNKAKVRNSVDVDLTNKAYIKNDVDVKANTGKNDFFKNTVLGNVTTGNVNVTGTIENVANENQCITCPDILGLVAGNSGPATNVDLSNDTTGPQSLNKNIVDVKNKTDIDVTNKAYIKNDIDVNANTGKNDFFKNTVVGNVTTGDVNVDFSVANQAN